MKKIERIKPVNGFDIKEYYDEETNRFKINKFANYLLDNFDFIKVNKALYFYKDGYYQTDDDYIEDLCVAHSDRRSGKMFSDSTIKNLMGKVKAYADAYEASETEEPFLIAFRNGIYDAKKNVLLPFTKDKFLTCKINWDYNPDAYSPMIDKLFDELSDNNKEKRALMEEIIGYSMIRSLHKQKAFFLVGKAGNGKSTYTGLIETLLGFNNISNVDMVKICKDKFAGSALQGKLANICNDGSGSFVEDPSTFKIITSGDTFMAERKYQDSFSFKSFATVIVCCQEVPRFKKADLGVRDRLVFLMFTRRFRGTKDCDDKLEEKLRDESCIEENMSYLINLGLAGLKRIEEKGFTVLEESLEALDEYDRDCNPMLDWCDEFLEEHGGTFIGVPTYIAYNDYDSWRQVTNNKVTTQRNLTKFIKDRYDLITDSKYYKPIGKSTQMFLPKDGGQYEQE